MRKVSVPAGTSPDWAICAMKSGFHMAGFENRASDRAKLATSTRVFRANSRNDHRRAISLAISCKMPSAATAHTNGR